MSDLDGHASSGDPDLEVDDSPTSSDTEVDDSRTSPVSEAPILKNYLHLYLKNYSDAKLKVNVPIMMTNHYDSNQEFEVTPLSNISPPYIPFLIKCTTGNANFIARTFLHFVRDYEISKFYGEKKNEGYLLRGNSLKNLFVFGAIQEGSFEIDKWCRDDFSDEDAINLFFSDLVAPSFGSYSQRISAMHSRLTEQMRDEMVENLNQIYYGQPKPTGDDAIDTENLPKLREKLTKPGVFAPPSSSPYALRGEHIRRSILCRGVDSMEQIEQQMMPWEQDFAINQATKWEEKVKAMVFTVVGALLTRQTDVRTTFDLKISSPEQNFLRYEFGNNPKPFFWPVVGGDITTFDDDQKRAITKLTEEINAKTKEIDKENRQLKGLKRKKNEISSEDEAEQLSSVEKKIEKKTQTIAKKKKELSTKEEEKENILSEGGKNKESVKARLESCAAPIWDSGVEKLPFGQIRTPGGFNFVTSDLTNKLVQYLVPSLVGNPDEDATKINLLKQKLGGNTKAQQQTYDIEWDTGYILDEIGYVQKTPLELRDVVRDTTRDKMVRQGTFSFTDKREADFAEKVWSYFSSYCTFDKAQTFIYVNSEYPDEGFSYEMQSVQFGPSNSANNSVFSIGHAVNLLMEGTEIAASFLQNSAWAHQVRINTNNPKKENVYFDRHYMKTNQAIFNDKKAWSTQEKESDKTFAFADRKKIYNYYSGELSPEMLGDWLAANFLGYCYERPHVIDKPMFAKLVHDPTIQMLQKKAQEFGFYNTENRDDNPVKEAKRLLFKMMKHEAHISGPTERRMQRLIQPYLVTITASSMGTGVQSFMHMENWWGPKPDFHSVDAECVYILKQLCRERFTRKRHFSGVLRYEGTIGSMFADRLTQANELSDFIKAAGSKQTAASIAVRLIEAVQAANESVSDGGRTQRDKAGRDYVNQARFSYGIQLLELQRNTGNI